MRYFYFSLILVFLVPLYAKGNLSALLDRIYERAKMQNAAEDTLGNYSYIQRIHFVKMDGDGEIEEQSRRVFRVFVKDREVRHRELLEAQNFEDGEWTTVTDEEKNKKRRHKSESKSFGLEEVVAPAKRDLYRFENLGEVYIEGKQAVHLKVESIEEDEERFNGDLYFTPDEAALIKAVLVPSDYPTGVDTMSMVINMQKIGDYWLPEKIHFDADISFLLIFSGKIRSDIEFSDFQFNRQFPDSLFADYAEEER